jgi:phosphoribosylformylglycinamidine synthase
LGADVDLAPLGSDLRADKLLFSESGGFVAEVKAGCEAEFAALFAGQPVTPVRLGAVTSEPGLRIAGLLSLETAQLAEAWTTGLARRLR